jgi:hypothetical protein
MTPFFDRNSNLVGWLNNDNKHIFDTKLNWVAFVSNNGSIWTVGKKTWVGNLYGTNIRDTNGKSAFWNSQTAISNSLKPLRPLNPLTPLKPLKPLKFLNPLKPLKPLTPLGGWPDMSWEQFINS